jgi:hypothetical protein
LRPGRGSVRIRSSAQSAPAAWAKSIARPTRASIAQSRSRFCRGIPDRRRAAPIDHADGQQYVVSPDGQRFLVNTLVDQPTPPITILLNWRFDARP